MTKTRSVLLFAIILLIALMLFSCGSDDYITSHTPLEQDSPATLTNHIINPDSEVRGVWIASVYNIDYPSKNTLSAGELRGEIDHILDTCEKNNINTVFFQVRPTCDALYKSDIFPVSSFLSKNGELIFDPLEYIVEAAHKRNIYVHAWVNPLRVTMNSHDIDSLPEKSPARENPDWAVPYADGKLYLNAAIPEVRELVADGVYEIVERMMLTESYSTITSIHIPSKMPPARLLISMTRMNSRNTVRATTLSLTGVATTLTS